MMQNMLPSVLQCFEQFQERFYSEIETTHYVKLLPKAVRRIPHYPQPKSIPCIAKEIPGSSEFKIILPASSVKIFFEEKKAVVRLLMTEYKIVKTDDDALKVFYSYVNSENTEDPRKIDELNLFLSKSESDLVSDMWSRPSTIFKAAWNYSQKTERTYLDAYKNSLKDKINIIEEVIIPALMSAQKVHEYVIEQEPCQFKVLKYNISEINDVSDYYVDSKSSTIFYSVKKIVKTISNKKNNSIDILDIIVSNINQINGEIKNIQIIKNAASMMNELFNNPEAIIDYNEFINNHYSPEQREDYLIKMAYLISITALKLAINGIGANSNSYLIFCGIRIFTNAANSTNNIFTISKDKIIPISLQICKEIQYVINEPFNHINKEKLEKNDKERYQYYKKLWDKYKNILLDLQNEYNNLIDELFNFIDEIASLLKEAINNFDTSDKFNVLEYIAKNVISKSIDAAKIAFSFDRKYRKMITIKKEIDFYKSKRCLISWIEQVFDFEINKEIFGIRIEINNYYLKLSNIFVNVFAI